MIDEQRIASIEAVITAQEAEGRAWTNQSIYYQIGGNYGELAQYLKARRATARRPGRGGGVAEAVAEAAIAAETPATLREQFDAARLAHAHASGRLAQLRSQGEALLLSEDEEDEATRLERRLERMQPVLERLGREVEQAQEVVDVEAFVAAWQPTAERKQALYTQFVSAVQQLWQSFGAILAQHDAQIEGLQQLPPRLQKYLLEHFLPDMGTMRQRLAGSMPTPAGWQAVLCTPHGPQLPRVEELMANDPGTKPLPPRLIQNALQRTQPVDRSA